MTALPQPTAAPVKKRKPREQPENPFLTPGVEKALGGKTYRLLNGTFYELTKSGKEGLAAPKAVQTQLKSLSSIEKLTIQQGAYLKSIDGSLRKIAKNVERENLKRDTADDLARAKPGATGIGGRKGRGAFTSGLTSGLLSDPTIGGTADLIKALGLAPLLTGLTAVIGGAVGKAMSSVTGLVRKLGGKNPPAVSIPNPPATTPPKAAPVTTPPKASPVPKVAPKVGREVGGKTIRDVIKKQAAKKGLIAAGKSVPFLGLGIAAIAAAIRASDGDWLGAAGEVASGVPVAGIPASLALMARDIYKDLYGVYPEQDGDLAKARMAAISKELKEELGIAARELDIENMAPSALPMPDMETPRQLPTAPTGKRPSVAKPAVAPTAKPAATPERIPAGESNSALMKFLKEQEGVKLSSYRDGYGKSIGYGHYITNKEKKQGFIQIGDEQIPLGQNLTHDQALRLKEQDVAIHEKAAMDILGKDTWERLNGNQRAAVTSYVYNVGPGQAKDRLKRLGRKVDAGDVEGAANELRTGLTTERGQINQGLVKRRRAEAALFKTQEVVGNPRLNGNQLEKLTKDTRPAGNQASAPTVVVNAPTNVAGGGGQNITGPISVRNTESTFTRLVDRDASYT